MSSSDEYILITSSQSSGGDAGISDAKIKEEDPDAALRALEEQGVFLEKDDDTPIRSKPRDEFSRELLDQSGIEIVSSEEEPYTP
ncbi:MAG: hypothetical protein AAB497_04130 [Patescibacteria group bacterium]